MGSWIFIGSFVGLGCLFWCVDVYEERKYGYDSRVIAHSKFALIVKLTWVSVYMVCVGIPFILLILCPEVLFDIGQLIRWIVT